MKIISKLNFKFFVKKEIWITTVIIILLLAGIIFGAFSDIFTDHGSWVVKIDEKYISVQDFEKELSKIKQDSQNLSKTSEELKRELLNIITIREVFEKEAKRYNVKITNDIVAKLIKKNASFHKDGKFSPDLFKAFLENNNVSEAYFIEHMKHKMIDSIVGSFGVNAITMDTDLAKLIDKSRKEQRLVDVYKLSVDKIKVDNNVSETEISDFYNKNRDLFIIPQKYNVSYIKGEDIYAKVQYNPSEDEVNYFISTNNVRNITKSVAKEVLKTRYICQALQDMTQNIHSSEDLENVKSIYGVNEYKDTEEENVNNSGKKEGNVYLSFTGNECYNVRMNVIRSIAPVRYVDFEQSKSKIKDMIIKQRRADKAKDVVDDLNKMIAKDNTLYHNISRELLKNGFVVNSGLLTTRDGGKISGAILNEIFVEHKYNFTKIVAEGDDTYEVAFLKNVIPSTKELSKDELKMFEDKIRNAKISDIYRLYYMNLQDRYDIKVNERYFGANVVK